MNSTTNNTMRRRGGKSTTPPSESEEATTTTEESHSLAEMAEQVETMARRASATSFHCQRNSVHTTTIHHHHHHDPLNESTNSSASSWEPISIVYQDMDTTTNSTRRQQQQQASQSTRRLERPHRRASVRPLEDFSLRYHTATVLRETWSLLQHLVHGTSKWVLKFLRLLCFVVALLPAFCVFATFYFVTSNRIARPYIARPDARTSRHYLDIYGSTTTSTTTAKEEPAPLKPVVLFLTGGAWIIGYKMWGTLLARTLVPFGILVVIPDYRNFPQTNIEGMMQDVDQAIDWTLQNIHKYGGDPNKVVIAGQSAGSHIGSCLLLKKAQQEPNVQSTKDAASSGARDSTSSWEGIPPPPTTTTTTSWHPADIKGFVAVSGPYDLVSMESILHQHGLDKNIVRSMFNNDLNHYSPTRTVRALQGTQRYCVQQHFPPTCIIHGQTDKTVPYQISLELFQAMEEVDLQQPVEFKLYPSWSHTDPILEAPFAGNHLFHRDVYDLVQLWTSNTSSSSDDNDDKDCLLLPFDESHPACGKICPLGLVQIARICNPF